MPGYLIKAANFVAEIANDDELRQLAQVDTIKKDTLVRVLPDKEWVEARTLPLLRRVWSLDVPAVPPPIPHAVSKATPMPPRLETVIDYRPEFWEQLAAQNGSATQSPSTTDSGENASDEARSVSKEAPRKATPSMLIPIPEELPNTMQTHDGDKDGFKAIASGVSDTASVHSTDLPVTNAQDMTLWPTDEENEEPGEKTVAVRPPMPPMPPMPNEQPATTDSRDASAQDLDGDVVIAEEQSGSETTAATPANADDSKNNSDTVPAEPEADGVEINLDETVNPSDIQDLSDIHPEIESEEPKPENLQELDEWDIDTPEKPVSSASEPQAGNSIVQELSGIFNGISIEDEEDPTKINDLSDVSDTLFDKIESIKYRENDVAAPDEDTRIITADERSNLQKTRGEKRKNVKSPSKHHAFEAQQTNPKQTLPGAGTSHPHKASAFDYDDEEDIWHGVQDAPRQPAGPRHRTLDWTRTKVRTTKKVRKYPEQLDESLSDDSPTTLGKSGANPANPEIPDNADSVAMPEELRAARAAVEAARHAVTQNGELSSTILKRAALLVDALEVAHASGVYQVLDEKALQDDDSTTSTGTVGQPKLSVDDWDARLDATKTLKHSRGLSSRLNIDSIPNDYLDESPSERFQMRSRRELERLVQNDLNDERLARNYPSRNAYERIPDDYLDESTSERFQVRSRKELEQLAQNDLNDERLRRNYQIRNDFDHIPDDYLDESPSERFQIRSRRELERLVQKDLNDERLARSYQNRSNYDRLPDDYLDEPTSERYQGRSRREYERQMSRNRGMYGRYPDPDDNPEMEQYRGRSNSMARRLMAEEARAVRANSQVIPAPDLSTASGTDMRRMFQQADELHLVLAHEIREKESDVSKELDADNNVEASFFDAPQTSEPSYRMQQQPNDAARSITDELPIRNPYIVAEPKPKQAAVTMITAIDGIGKTKIPHTQDDDFFKEKLEPGEQLIAQFDTLYLTSRRLWNIKGRKYVSTYESYDIQDIQWVGLKEERKWTLMAVVLALTMIALAFYIFFPRMEILAVVIYGVIMFIVCLIVFFRTTIQIGLQGGTIVRSDISITRKNRIEASTFLNHVDATRLTRRHQLGI